MELSQFGDVLRTRRKELQLNQKQVARKACITQPMLSNYENGTKDISLNMLSRITRILDLKIDIRITPIDR